MTLPVLCIYKRQPVRLPCCLDHSPSLSSLGRNVDLRRGCQRSLQRSYFSFYYYFPLPMYASRLPFSMALPRAAINMAQEVHITKGRWVSASANLWLPRFGGASGGRRPCMKMHRIGGQKMQSRRGCQACRRRITAGAFAFRRAGRRRTAKFNGSPPRPGVALLQSVALPVDWL